MKRQISLKRFISLSFLALAVILIIGYSMLSMRFFFLGMDNIIADNMIQAVNTYVETIPSSMRQKMNFFSGYRICRSWSQMPEEVREFCDKPEEVGRLYINNDAESFARSEKMFFIMQVINGGNDYFIIHTVTRENASPFIGRNSKRNFRLLLMISLVIALAIGTIVWCILKRVEQPVTALGRWARRLNAENLNETPPDFFYPELNELAVLIRTSLSSVQKSLEREHWFLRHSSHELRTPISIIRNNVELLQMLQAKNHNTDTHQNDPRHKKIIQRIDRASLTMKHLTETLLWLSRDSEVKLPLTEVDIDQFVRDLATEAQYLLRKKGVEVILETRPFKAEIAETPARIIIGNLIRNAFQHTWSGTVHICQTGGLIEVSNTVVKENDQDLGFGLGLNLIKQLSNKLNWPYTSHEESGRHFASISLTGHFPGFIFKAKDL